MKRISKIVAFLCVLGAFFCFASCEQVPDKTEMTVNIRVVCEGLDKCFTVSGELATVEDAMVALAEKDGEFYYGGEDGEYGLYLHSVCGYEVGANEFWGLYTDTVREDAMGLPNVLEEFSLTVDGVTYYFCANGASYQAVADGETVLFAVGSF